MITVTTSDTGLFTGWSRSLIVEDNLEERDDQCTPVQDFSDPYLLALCILKQHPATLSPRNNNR